MRQYYRFMELEPVVEMEEDACEESSSSSSGPPSLSPPPFGSDYWSEDSLYAGLAREHAELQRSHHALELRLKRSEARARAANERLQQLQAEAQELRELAELQEFRILELEGAGDHTTPARSPGPDTRDVCTDMENDDVSDSGVLSLPASEDVSSDCDLGVHDLKLELPPVPDLKDKLLEAARALSNVDHKWTLHQAAALLDDARLAIAHANATSTMNHSLKSLPDYALNGDPAKFPARIVATVPPFNEMLQTTKLPLDAKISTKQINGTLLKPNKIVSTLAANFCLRCSEELCTQGTQTDNNAVPSHGDLRAEIQKLNQFRERVEERGGDLAFCRERLNALEDKIRLYERNGNAQESLLNEKKEKEVQLTSQVEQLTAKIVQLKEEKSHLDEQRCELEEAENDTRLRCQKLELKLQLISEENRDLQSKLLQERRVNTNLKSSMKDGDKLHREISYLQSMLGTYEERNFELEERETEVKHHFDLLVSWWPVVLVWNILRTANAFQSKIPLPIEYKPLRSPRREKRDIPKTCNGLCRTSQERLVQRMKELERELRIKLSKDSAASQKTDRETMTDTNYDEVRTPTKHEECCKQLRQVLQNEATLKHKVRDLEQKEKAYMETLQEADELWSELEGGYQRQLDAARASEAELRARLDAAESAQRLARGRNAEADAAEELEQSVREATAVARRAEEERATAVARVAHLADALAAADAAADRLTRDIEQLKPRLAQEKRLNADLRSELAAKGEAMDSMQEAFEKDIDKLKSQVSILEKDNLQLSKECDELKFGIEKLQNVLRDQQEQMMQEREQHEKALANLSNTLAEKERDLERVISMTRDEDCRSAQEELEEAEASQNHKPSDFESEDETSSPQYSTFPRSAREKTVLPPIKPPRRVKKMDVKKAKEAMTNKSYSLELISNTQTNVEPGLRGRNRSLQDISPEGMTNDYLISGQERNERAPTPIPNPKREANSTKKSFIAYLPSAEPSKCQTPSDNPCKPAIRGWRSQPESHRKSRNLPGIDLCLSPSSAVYYIGTI